MHLFTCGRLILFDGKKLVYLNVHKDMMKWIGTDAPLNANIGCTDNPKYFFLVFLMVLDQSLRDLGLI